MKTLFCVMLVGCSSASFPVEEANQTDSGVASDTGTVVVNDTATTADAPALDDRIDPIASGRSWTYNVEIYGSYPGCTSGTATGRVLRNGLYQGKQAFEVQSFCPGFGASWYAVEGDVVDLYYKAWIRVVDAPVTDGHSWSNGATTVAWRKEAKVTTPAGTFDNCFRAEQSVGYPSYTVFCRGVGPVVWYTKDLAGNGYRAELVSKSF
jgi:hypothetical protein